MTRGESVIGNETLSEQLDRWLDHVAVFKEQRAEKGLAVRSEPGFRVTPYPIKHALPFCKRVHRRLPNLQGAMWALGLRDPLDCIKGVAIVGRPSARALDDGVRLQVLRVAVEEGVPNGCSMLYGACSRAARGMGASDLLTYIHDDETGVSLKASGWIEDSRTDGGQWGRPSRQRELAIDAKPKRRFLAPWSAMLRKAA